MPPKQKYNHKDNKRKHKNHHDNNSTNCVLEINGRDAHPTGGPADHAAHKAAAATVDTA